MKFTIITPTNKRPEQLLRSTLSVFWSGNQRNDLYIDMIIVNDSPDYDYSSFENNDDVRGLIENNRIIYIKNKINKGKNYSCNLALSTLSSKHNHHIDQNHYIIFLDDDDWLADGALLDIEQALHLYNSASDNDKLPELDWLVTNRAQIISTGELLPLTVNNTNREIYNGYYHINYFWDCMIFKRFTGDATHIIRATLALHPKFASHVRNGEEWYYFINLSPHFIYANINSTISGGYNPGGLTEELRNKYYMNTWALWKERLNIKIIFYLILRSLLSIKRHFL